MHLSRPTVRNLFLLVILILTLNTFRSVRFAHCHMISKITTTSLNAFYYTLKAKTYDHRKWNEATTKKALGVVPDSLADQPLFLSIDDTMVEKFGKNFALYSKLYDHAAHHGSNYLNGHYMVSLLLSFPVFREGKIHYCSIPFGYRLLGKGESKLALVAELVTQTMDIIRQERQLLLLCDSWYPKKEVTALVETFQNLELLCNVRADTVLYDLPPAPTGKRGRPRKRGARFLWKGSHWTSQKLGTGKLAFILS